MTAARITTTETAPQQEVDRVGDPEGQVRPLHRVTEQLHGDVEQQQAEDDEEGLLSIALHRTGTIRPVYEEK